MILSVSRRTDIPAFFSDWFFNRIEAGFVCVRNPFDRRSISRIVLSPEFVDCIVFWSKNPLPMLSRLDRLKEYMYYFQFTLNPYDSLIERNVPCKADVVETFKRLSDMIGARRVIWRYDPVILTDVFSREYHVDCFAHLARQLEGYTDTCIISFIDMYNKTQRNMSNIAYKDMCMDDMLHLAKGFVSVAGTCGMRVRSCAEAADLEAVGVAHGSCIDGQLIGELLGKKVCASKDRNQRRECGCIQSVDIGEYDTCPHACVYCYANADGEKATRRFELHNPASPLLIGCVEEKDRVSDRTMRSVCGTADT